MLPTGLLGDDGDDAFDLAARLSSLDASQPLGAHHPHAPHGEGLRSPALNELAALFPTMTSQEVRLLCFIVLPLRVGFSCAEPRLYSSLFLLLSSTLRLPTGAEACQPVLFLHDGHRLHAGL